MTTTPVNMRFPTDLKAELEKEAAGVNRTLTNYIIHLLATHQDRKASKTRKR